MRDVLQRRCADQRCDALRQATASADLQAIRSAIEDLRRPNEPGSTEETPDSIVEEETPDFLQEPQAPRAPQHRESSSPFAPSCTEASQALAAIEATDSIQAAADAIPPRWTDAWSALRDLPAVPRTPRSTFVSDDLVQQITAGCYSQMARWSEQAFSQANWSAATRAALRAQECGRAQPEDGPTPEELAALGERAENAVLCASVTLATTSTSWTSAISAMEAIGDAPAATRLTRTEQGAITRAVRTGRSALQREERASEQAARRCEDADRRADRCAEICADRHRGAGRCFDMCERRYPGCRDSEGSEGVEPVLSSLRIRLCESPTPASAAGSTRSSAPRAERPNGSRRPRRAPTQPQEVNLGDFE